MPFTYIDTPYSDRNAAPPIHDDACDELCNHCALCGEGIYIGARCPSHMGVYPLTDREDGSALEAAHALGVAVDQANRDEEARARLDALMRCTCPSGDGSLRWPCPTHPPTTDR